VDIQNYSQILYDWKCVVYFFFGINNIVLYQFIGTFYGYLSVVNILVFVSFLCGIL